MDSRLPRDSHGRNPLMSVLALSYSDSVITGISTLNWFDPKLSRAVSDFNDAKVFTLNYIWDVPMLEGHRDGFLRSATGGWELGGIFSASSGEPFTPLLVEGDVLGQNNSDKFAYPNRVNSPGCSGNAVNPGKCHRLRQTSMLCHPACSYDQRCELHSARQCGTQ